jgi:hypothetical protein
MIAQVERVKANSEPMKKFTDQHRRWITDLVHRQPLLFAHEIARRFPKHFYEIISISSVLRIMYEANLCKKVVERRALQVTHEDIARFVSEIELIRPRYHQLVFLDEMGVDNKSMIRRRGWFLRGAPPKRQIYVGIYEEAISSHLPRCVG